MFENHFDNQNTCRIFSLSEISLEWDLAHLSILIKENQMLLTAEQATLVELLWCLLLSWWIFLKIWKWNVWFVSSFLEMYIFVEDTYHDFSSAHAYNRVLVGLAISFYGKIINVINTAWNPAFLILPIGTKSLNWIFDVVCTWNDYFIFLLNCSQFVIFFIQGIFNTYLLTAHNVL